jgi:hypothetical protein
MSQNRSRQIVRLEELAQPYLKRRRQIEKEWEQIHSFAVDHAAILAFIIRHGAPIIDEPLSCAWQRCSESSAWIECCERFPSTSSPSREGIEDFDPPKYPFEPNSRNIVPSIGMSLRHVVIASFPGADEKEKLNAVFASAPPWLIWFTFADYTAKLLGLTLPDLSSVAGFARSKANFDLWCGFPGGAFERRPWPLGPDSEPLAGTDLKLLRPEMERPDNQVTTRERKRATYMASHAIKRPDDWPCLVPSYFLEMSFEEQTAHMAKLGFV